MRNPKHQAPNPKQFSSIQIPNMVWNLVLWNLFGAWDLEFGI
jgi:hypothetical protein